MQPSLPPQAPCAPGSWVQPQAWRRLFSGTGSGTGPGAPTSTRCAGGPHGVGRGTAGARGRGWFVVQASGKAWSSAEGKVGAGSHPGCLKRPTPSLHVQEEPFNSQTASCPAGKSQTTDLFTFKLDLCTDFLSQRGRNDLELTEELSPPPPKVSALWGGPTPAGSQPACPAAQRGVDGALTQPGGGEPANPGPRGDNTATRGDRAHSGSVSAGGPEEPCPVCQAGGGGGQGAHRKPPKSGLCCSRPPAP